MSAFDILEEARNLGLTVEVADASHLRISGPRPARDRVRPALIANKAALLRLLDGNEAADEAGDIVRAARLLRDGLWPAVPPVCDFLIGRPGERCRRCGASWSEHFSS